MREYSVYMSRNGDAFENGALIVSTPEKIVGVVKETLFRLTNESCWEDVWYAYITDIESGQSAWVSIEND